MADQYCDVCWCAPCECEAVPPPPARKRKVNRDDPLPETIDKLARRLGAVAAENLTPIKGISDA